MPSIIAELDRIFRAAIHDALNVHADPQLGVAQNQNFGDYQSNAAMGLVKPLQESTGKNLNPRAIAEQIKTALKLGDLGEATIAGPGFINVRLNPAWLSHRMDSLSVDRRLGVEPVAKPQNVVVDYSGPNVAKEMHVGHLRSTIIGDAISRVLEFQGEHVIRQNHIGDWGTQFGKVVLAIWYAALAEATGRSAELQSLMDRMQIAGTAKDDAAKTAVVRALAEMHRKFIQEDPDGKRIFEAYLKRFPLDLPALEKLYQFAGAIVETPAAKTEWIEHPLHGKRTLEELPRLFTKFIQHPEDPKNEQEVIAWKTARKITLDTCYEIYGRLGVKLRPEDERAESFYNPMLPGVVSDLFRAGLAVQSEGATAVFIDGPQKPPLIVEKSDGGYLYGTTDLAGIRYRVNQLHANRIIYTHDSRQSQHFDQVFRIAQKAGWANGVSLEFAPFGTMLGEDGRPFKTRSGATVKLKDLLDEAEERALRVVTEKNPDLPETPRKAIAHAVGIGGVKYSDLSKDRNSDYLFSFDKMLALDGNTAPYLQYAHARIRSIFRKAAGSTAGQIDLQSPFELALAKHILRLSEIIDLVGRELKPHHLSTYLYELAAKFSGFYENCPVLQSQDPVRASRLALCDLAARTLELGLDLLGIEHPDQM